MNRNNTFLSLLFFYAVVEEHYVTPERLLSIHPHLSEPSQEDHEVHTCILGPSWSSSKPSQGVFTGSYLWQENMLE